MTKNPTARSKGLGILATAREGGNSMSKLIIVVIGGLSAHEISALAEYERDMLREGIWSKERIFVGSVPVDGRGCVFSADDFISSLSRVKLTDLAAQQKPVKKKKTKAKDGFASPREAEVLDNSEEVRLEEVKFTEKKQEHMLPQEEMIQVKNRQQKQQEYQEDEALPSNRQKFKRKKRGQSKE